MNFLTKMLVVVPAILFLVGCAASFVIQDKKSWLDENCVRITHPKMSPYYECDHSLLDTD